MVPGEEAKRKPSQEEEERKPYLHKKMKRYRKGPRKSQKLQNRYPGERRGSLSFRRKDAKRNRKNGRGSSEVKPSKAKEMALKKERKRISPSLAILILLLP